MCSTRYNWGLTIPPGTQLLWRSLRSLFRRIYSPLGSCLFNKVADLKACNFLKNRLWHARFPANIAKLLRTAFSIENLWWLLLDFLQNLLKATVKKIISRQFFSEISEKLFLVFAASFLKIIPSQGFFAVLVFL